jgi:hypothetical protein
MCPANPVLLWITASNQGKTQNKIGPKTVEPPIHRLPPNFTETPLYLVLTKKVDSYM